MSTRQHASAPTPAQLHTARAQAAAHTAAAAGHGDGMRSDRIGRH